MEGFGKGHRKSTPWNGSNDWKFKKLEYKMKASKKRAIRKFWKNESCTRKSWTKY